MRHGLLFFRHQLFLPVSGDFRQRILNEMHESFTPGHSGFKPTLAWVAASFYWPGWTRDTRNFVQQCSTCQRNKYLPHNPQGLIQPLPIPAQVWEDSMNFITHLPSSAGHTVIWVVCDCLTKYAHFVALPTHFTAPTLACRFSIEICRLHGLPKTIVSDRDPLFVNTFWRTLFKAQGTALKFSLSYHPQIDSQIKVLNRGLETYLQCFASDHSHPWYQHLHLVELWYNTSYHSAIDISPFHALYGRPPPTTLDMLHIPRDGTTISYLLRQHIVVLHSLKQNLRRTHQCMVDQANQYHTDRSFNVSYWVWVRLQPYRQSVHRRSCPKLASRYSGPNQILRRIRNVAYELQLPPTSKIHPIFHVCLYDLSKENFPHSPQLSFQLLKTLNVTYP